MFRQTAAYSFQPPDRPGFRCHQIMMIVMMIVMLSDNHDDGEGNDNNCDFFLGF